MASPLTDTKVDVEGLAALQKQLRQAGPEMAALLKGVNLKAAELIVNAAKESARAQGGVAAHAVEGDSIRAKGEQRNAIVVLDGGKRSAHPEILGAEYGSVRFHQFKKWRGNKSTPDLWDDGGAGYFLQPSIRANRERIMALYLDLLDQTLRGAFPQ